MIYAYGEGWGTWNTRVQPITLTLAEKEGYLDRMAAEKKVACLPDPVNRAPAKAEGERDYIMVRTQYDVYEYPMSKKAFTLLVYAYDEYFEKIQLDRRDEKISFVVYDESVMTIEGVKATIHGVGSTTVEIHYGDELLNVFYVNIVETEKEEIPGNPPVSMDPVFDSYTIYMGERGNYRPQIRVRVWYSDDSFEEFYVDTTDAKLTFSGFDANMITVSPTGIVTAFKPGETTIKVSYKDMTCDVKIIVTEDESKAYYKTGDAPVLDYTQIDFTKPESMEIINGTNNASATMSEEGLLLVVNDVGLTPDMTDAIVRLNYGKSLVPLMAENYDYLEITYKVSPDNSDHATRAQFFICAGAVQSETVDCQIMVNLETDGEYHTLRIKLSNYNWWTGTLNQIRFDFFDASVGGDTMIVSSIKLTK